MKKSKIVSIKKIPNDTVYALETTTGTFIADGVYHHNCSFRCNRMRSGEHEKYRVALDLKYGDGTADKLERLVRSTPIYSLKKDELLGIIEDCKVQIKFIIDNR